MAADNRVGRAMLTGGGRSFQRAGQPLLEIGVGARYTEGL